jgi:GNAT superfamily N-acetyltransferase
MLTDGYTEVPPGKIAAIVTFLEMRTPPPRRHAPSGPWRLERIHGVATYRDLYHRVGEPWLWWSRALLPDAALKAILDDPKVEAFALMDGARSIGLLELDFREPAACELAFFGVILDAIGTGAGRFLMNVAVERAFAEPIARFWVHTCTLDHPDAVRFYIRSGFTPYKRAIEVEYDPRLSGRFSKEAAPHAPVIAPSRDP